MRAAADDEVAAIVAALRQPTDEDIPDRDAAIATVDNYLEWLASIPSELRVQVAYDRGDVVEEWGGLRAAEPMARVTPAAVLNSIVSSVLDGASLAFTGDGLVWLLREPDEAR